MHQHIAIIAIASFGLTACGTEEAASNQTEKSTEVVLGTKAPANASLSDQQSSGTLTIGGQSWTFVPSIQCRVYPGNVVSIAGIAAEDPAVEIVIDLGGPDGVSVGKGADSWQAVVDSISASIDGQSVTGSAEFKRSGSMVPGTFDIRC